MSQKKNEIFSLYLKLNTTLQIGTSRVVNKRRRYRRLLERFRRLQIGRDKREKSGHYQNALKKIRNKKQKENWFVSFIISMYLQCAIYNRSIGSFSFVCCMIRE